MTEMAAGNPPLSQWVRVLSLVVFLFLCFGATLLIAPSLVVPYWAWRITPFNARFLGGVYLAEAVPVLVLIVCNRWSPARVGLTAAVLFTSVISIASWYHFDQFISGRRTMVWFAVYLGYVIAPLLALWAYRQLPRAPALPAAASLRMLLIGSGTLTAAYAAALFVFPTSAAAFWPWPIDAMHGRIYSGMFLGSGVALLMIARNGAREEFWIAGGFLLTLGLAAIAGLVVTDMAVRRVNWTSVGTWVWIGWFLHFAGLGAAILQQSTRPQPAATAPA